MKSLQNKGKTTLLTDLPDVVKRSRQITRVIHPPYTQQKTGLTTGFYYWLCAAGESRANDYEHYLIFANKLKHFCLTLEANIPRPIS